MDTISLSQELEFKRVSLISEQKFSIRDSQTNKTKEELAPPDTFHVTYILFFFFGLGSIIPHSFFLTSQDYWMYKFRDTSLDSMDLRNKTLLQKNFVSISGLSHTIPLILTTIVASYYGHKVHIYKRLTVTVGVILVAFISYTVFIEINTDSWQLGFFILTITVSGGITIATSIFSTTNLAIMSRFPQNYLRCQMFGQASASILSSLLQILCLYLGNESHTKTALIYFLCGTALILITLGCVVISRYVPRFVYYLGDTKADTKRPTLIPSEIKELVFKLWPNIILLITATLTSGMGHPTITTLVVSEYYGRGDLWPDKYFEPVITFLVHYIVGLCGRISARPLLNPRNAVWWVIADSLKYIIVNPMFLFCNAQPRSHLPVLFLHDWEYIIIVVVAEYVTAFFYMSTFLSMKNMLPGKAEKGYLLMASLSSLVSIFHSALATFWVNLI